MSQEQTILRAELNGLSTTISGITDLQIQSLGTGTTLSYSGTGTNNDHYVGTMFRTTSGASINVNFTNLGSNGTLYYSFLLPAYTGTSTNFFENYYFQCEYNDNTIFTEYAISGITNQSIKLNKNDSITFIIKTLYSALNTTFNVFFIPNDELEDELVTYEVLDLYSTIPIQINKSFAELQDIGKRNSDYSVGLLLPGSKKNNRFFENYYNVDSVTLFFDVTKRVPIKVLVDGESYLTGYLRLNKVSLINSKIEYDVTLFSNVADLYGKIGNNLLQDLNFNEPNYHFNHFFGLYNVIAGWQQNLLLEQNDVPLYFYPALHNGYLYSGDTVNPSGGTVASQSRFYTSTKVGTFTDYAAFVASGGTEYYINSPKKPVLDNQLKPALSVWGLIQLMFKSYGYTIKSDFFNTPWFKTIYMYGYFSSDTTKFGYQVQSIQTFPLQGVDIVFYSSGGNDYAVVCKLGTGIPSFCESNINVVFQYDEGEPFGIVDYPLTIIAGTTGATSNYGGTFYGGYSSQVPNGASLAYFPVAAGTFVNYVDGDYVNFNLTIDPKIKQIDLLSSIAKKFNLILVPNPENPYEIMIEPYDYYIGSGDIYDWTDKLSYDKGFTVQPALNYIESELLLTDLDDGDDGNKQFKDQNNRLYGENYIYNETDFKSQQKKIDTIFSPEIIRKWDNRIGMPLGINYAASSDLNTTTNRVNYKYKGVKTKPKIMFNLGNFSPFLDQVGESYNFGSFAFRVNTMFFRVQQSDGTNPLGETFALTNSSNPIISHTMPIGNPDSNKINNDSLCVLFNCEQPVDTIGVGISSYNAYTENDIYKNFYLNRISNLYNKITRFFNGYFYLKLSDIKNLKVNDLIKINDQYFTWNKIEQYNLTNRELTKVELIQYNSAYSTYPNRFFKYQYCGDGQVYKFRTYLNPSDNPEVGNDLSLYYTYYYWSVFYDYMVGVLGGSVSGFTTSFPNYSGDTTGIAVGRLAATMNEITEDEYDSIVLTFKEDENDSIQNGMLTLPLTTNIRLQNPMIWVFSNSGAFAGQKAFFNVAVNCAAFTGYCSTNDVVLSNPLPPNITPTPTPTPTVTTVLECYIAIAYDCNDINCGDPNYGVVHIIKNTSTLIVNKFYYYEGQVWWIYDNDTLCEGTEITNINSTAYNDCSLVCPTPTPTPTITTTITRTPTLTPTPSSTPVPCVQVQTDEVYVYQYTLSGNTNTLLFDPATELIADIALGNDNFYTLIYTDAFATGYTINQYASTLSPLSITTGVTDTWTFYDGDYPGLDASAGLEIKDNNTLLIGGSSIYELNLSGSTYTKLFDLVYPDSYVIGDFIYNPYTNRIILLAYGQDFTTYEISEYYMNGTLYATYEFTYDFGTYFDGFYTYNIAPAALFVNNNNLYMSTDWERDIYQINLSTGAPTYVQSITGGTYNICKGFGAPNQCNNVSLSPSPTFTPTPTITLTPTTTVTPTPTAT